MMRHGLNRYSVPGRLLVLAAFIVLLATHAVRSEAAPVSVTTTAFNPTDDAYVAGSFPADNFGTAITLQSDASPILETYLKFDLQSLAEQTVLSAKLRMWVI